MRILLSTLLLSTSFLMFLISCGNSVEFKKNPMPKFQGGVIVTNITFDEISNQILKPQCIKCHAGYGDYGAVFAEKEGILDAVLKGRMPKNAPALNNNLKAVLNEWVRGGAPSGDGSAPPTPTKLVATWESLSKKVIFRKCVQCHNPDGRAEFLDLSTRQKFFEQRHDLLNNFVDAKNSYLIQVITDPEEPMPPPWSKVEPVTAEELRVLIEWIEKGLP